MTKRKRTTAANAEPKLTVKQKMFAGFFAQCLNGTQSAREAGYRGNDATLAAVASENLRKPKVKAYVDKLLEARALSKGEVLARISEQAAGDMSDFLEVGELEGVNTINLAQARDAGKLHLLKSVKVSKGAQGATSISVELYSAQNALDKLMKYYGLYQERLDLTSGGKPFDVSRLSDEQLRRLADGDDPATILTG